MEIENKNRVGTRMEREDVGVKGMVNKKWRGICGRERLEEAVII